MHTLLLFRMRKRQPPREPTLPQPAYTPYKHQNPNASLAYTTTPPSYYTHTDTSGENEYEYVDDLKLPPPPPPVQHNAPNTGTGCVMHALPGQQQQHYNHTGTLVPNYSQHQGTSGSNTMKKAHPGNEYVSDSSSPYSPKYFELDPDGKDGIGYSGKKYHGDGTTGAIQDHNGSGLRNKQYFGHYSQ